jgi:riboflavin synthase
VSIAMSTLGERQVGDRVDIERAAALGDRLGGHIVQGHIDGTATVLAVTPGDAWRVLRFTLDPEHAPLVVRKGSIAVNGVSLTVSDAGDDWFEVSLIPETLTATTLGALAPGDRVNIETDILARHVQRLMGFHTRPAAPGATQPAGSRSSGFDTRPAGPGATQPTVSPSGAVGAFAAGSVGIYGHGGSADAPAGGRS